MRHTFKDADFKALTELWNTFYPAQFAIDEDVFRLNTVESPVFDWGASSFEAENGKVTGFVVVKRSANPRMYGGPESDLVHLSAIAYDDVGLGIELFAEAKHLLRNRGVSSIVFGQDSRHFFPGCPVGLGNLCSFLMVEGFTQSGEAWDLERDLGDYEFKGKSPQGAVFQRLESKHVKAFADFMEEEFPGRWRYDTLEKVRVEGPGTVIGLFWEGKIGGFALVQDFTQKEPVNGCVWRPSLGANWGGLGPIGVAKSLRGKGLGDALLGNSLRIQREAGVRRCIIDWTNLVEFYGKHGFEVTRHYKCLNLKLD